MDSANLILIGILLSFLTALSASSLLSEHFLANSSKDKDLFFTTPSDRIFSFEIYMASLYCLSEVFEISTESLVIVIEGGSWDFSWLLVQDTKDQWSEVVVKSQGIKGWMESSSLEKI